MLDETIDSKPGKPATKTSPKPATKPAATKPERKVSAYHRVKQMLCDNPTLTEDDLVKQLKAEGLKLSSSSLSGMRSDFLNSLKVIQAA